MVQKILQQIESKKFLNVLLLVFLTISAICNILMLDHFVKYGIALYDLVFIIIVRSEKTKYYEWIWYRSILYLIVFFSAFIFYFTNNGFMPNIMVLGYGIILLASIPVALLSYYIEQKWH